MERSDFVVPDSPEGLTELHFNESTFGLTEFSQVLDERFGDAKPLACLEIGSGSGFLLARLKERYPMHRWEGVEPIGEGFARFEAARDAIAKRFDLNVHRTTIEEFATARRFDFIFSLNVIEHLGSWRDCLAKAHSLLAPGGAAVFLCPNYSFPYEPHYALPVIANKRVTHEVFRRAIDRYDAKHDTSDLWTSLNFIKKREVVSFCKERGIDVRFDERIMSRMVEKLWTDAHFAERQRLLSGPAKLLHRLGVTRLVESSPLRWISPYQKIIVTRG